MKNIPIQILFFQVFLMIATKKVDRRLERRTSDNAKKKMGELDHREGELHRIVLE